MEILKKGWQIKDGGEKMKGDQTQLEGTCCWWTPAQSVFGAVVHTGPTSHLQSKCLVHRAGISCTASPSSGLGHLQIHGRLKQETATQYGCYATGEEGSRASCLLSEYLLTWQDNQRAKSFEAWWKCMKKVSLKIVKIIWVAVLDQAVERAIVGQLLSNQRLSPKRRSQNIIYVTLKALAT